MSKFQARHGDLLIQQVSTIPAEAKKVRPSGDVILAYGEVTGHAHRIGQSQFVTQFDFSGRSFINVAGVPSVPLTHEEHNTINIPAGNYEVIRQKVYDYQTEMTRAVAD